MTLRTVQVFFKRIYLLSEVKYKSITLYVYKFGDKRVDDGKGKISPPFYFLFVLFCIIFETLIPRY